ncbi:copper resistance CopC family protein [Microtetraspora malaysiensis]|uniref:copper resistance CopC family protein n=1 Tax=Microtetraspora malaysiensis TaxID=161358 RepID=UPI003D91C3E4
MRKSPLAAVVAFVVTLLLGTALAMPALAHTSLRSSDPKENSRVDALTKVNLTFSESVRYPVVLVRGPDGRQYESGTPAVHGSEVTQAVSGSLPAGKYSVAWRVVSSDGHPIEGEIPFTVTGSAAAGQDGTEAAAVAPSTPAASGGTPAPEQSAAPAAATAAADDQAEADTGKGGVPAWVWIVVFGIGGVGIGMAISMRKKP